MVIVHFVILWGLKDISRETTFHGDVQAVPVQHQQAMNLKSPVLQFYHLGKKVVYFVTHINHFTEQFEKLR